MLKPDLSMSSCSGAVPWLILPLLSAHLKVGALDFSQKGLFYLAIHVVVRGVMLGVGGWGPLCSSWAW